MTKELKALEEVKNYIEDNITTKHNYVEPEIKIVGEALQRLADYNNLIKEYDMKPTEIREAFLLYKMKYTNLEKEIEKLWWYIDLILDKALGQQRTKLSKENKNE